jgi:DNA gyrase/topoisomerase IV subunit B
MNIEEKYKAITNIEHVLLRPTVYMGSILESNKFTEYYDNSANSVKYAKISQVTALTTLVNELLTNSYDEYIRAKQLNNKKPHLDTIAFDVDYDNNTISIWDNGGIPIEFHKDVTMWLPHMLFGRLYTSENYTNSREDVGGTNGVGAVIVNIFSTEFYVETAKDGKKFSMTWHNNMSTHSTPKISKCAKHTHYTYIKAKIDTSRFKLTDSTNIMKDMLSMFHLRAIEIAAMGSAKQGALNVKFNNVAENTQYEYKYEHYWQFTKLHVDTQQSAHWGESYDNHEFEIGLSTHGTLNSCAIVNSIRCDHGTHVDQIVNPIAHYLKAFIERKHKIKVQRNVITQKISIFSKWKIPAPEFTSQLKEILSTDHKEFGFAIHISDKFKRSLENSEIVHAILDHYRAKSAEKEQQELRKHNKKVTPTKAKRVIVDKLVDATASDRSNCELYIVEGDSAKGGIRRFRNGMTQGAYALRGVPNNTYYMSATELLQKDSKGKFKHAEIINLVMSLGLKLGEPVDYALLRYHKIIIAADADVDGSHITGLLLQLFYKFWPELIKNGNVYRCITPIVVAIKGSDYKAFYTIHDFKKQEQKLIKQKYIFKYKKGLATLTNPEYKSMLQNPYLTQFTLTDKTNSIIDAWFGNDANKRRQLINNN